MIVSNKQYEPEILHKLWEVELEILDVIDAFCKEHHIKYSIAYGTLLGAVRHKGFIPWDDDIDIMMLREDYNRFHQLWLENPPKGFVFVDDLLYDEYHENFAKIRKEDTTFIQFDSEYNVKKMPLGIFVDVFVLDRVAPKGFQRKKQYFYSLVNMLYTRKHPSGKRGLVGLGERVLLALPSGFQKKIKEHARYYTKRWNDNNSCRLANFCTLEDASFLFPFDTMANTIFLDFADRKYSVTSNYDAVLKTTFKDYRQLPPENQRASHYPLLLDFTHSWEEIVKKQKESVENA